MFNYTEMETSIDFLDISEEVFEENYNKVFNTQVKDQTKQTKLVRDEVSQAFYKLYH